MDAKFAFHLRRPCKNRGIEYGEANSEYVTLNGNKFYTMREAEEYLEKFPRKDMPLLTGTSQGLKQH